jgi:hypothetical protein
MFNNAALDVVIGLVFVYLLYSLLGTLLQEIIATNIGLRGMVLEKAVKRMLNDDHTNPGKQFSDAFYGHPLIAYLSDGCWPLGKRPSYIDQDTFSKVVIDLLRGQAAMPGSDDRKSIQSSLQNKELAWDTTFKIQHQTSLYLCSVWADSQGDVAKFKTELEQWFNEMMDRTTGWYKKYTQLILMGVGLLIAVVFNVDTIKIEKQLQTNPALRAQVVAQADAYVKAHPNLDQQLAQTSASMQQLDSGAKKDSLKHSLSTSQKEKKISDSLYTAATNLVGTDLHSLNSTLAIGWQGKCFCDDFNSVTLIMIVGWILTALAISMGAPFWFDLLNKLMQLRSSVSPKDDNSSKPTNNDPKPVRVG